MREAAQAAATLARKVEEHKVQAGTPAPEHVTGEVEKIGTKETMTAAAPSEAASPVPEKPKRKRSPRKAREKKKKEFSEPLPPS
jgi:hypothetical protein